MDLMTNPPTVTEAIDCTYRTTIDLAEDSPHIEYVCGAFTCDECPERKTCDTVRTADEWRRRYQAWKESLE